MEVDEKTQKSPSGDHLLQWNQWQLLDSILPTGGFAHSYGLEAAVQAGMVLGQEDLKAYIIQIIENTGSLLLPFVNKANRFPDLETSSLLDRTLEATLTNEVSRKASVTQGSAPKFRNRLCSPCANFRVGNWSPWLRFRNKSACLLVHDDAAHNFCSNRTEFGWAIRSSSAAAPSSSSGRRNFEEVA